MSEERTTPPPNVTPAALFMAFLRVALSGFGGVLYWAHYVIVEDRRWLSDEEFTDAMSLCQFLPGPNTMNLTIVVGMRFCGARGAFAALAGLMIAPFMIVLGLGVLYTEYAHVPAVESVFRGISAVAAGMMVSMGVKMALVARIRNVLAVVAVAAFVAVALLRLPLLIVLLTLAPAGIGLAWWRSR